MIVGVLKEIKNHEYRVGLTPAGAAELVNAGHKVLVETKSGVGVGFGDELYQQAGALITTADEIFDQAAMIIKVKEPLASEYSRLKSGQILFTYLHLAPDLKQTEGLLKSDAIAFAYETVTDDFGGLPLLRPMSEVAGRMSIQAGAYSLEKSRGGKGILISGVVGVAPAKVLVIGGGVVGLNAARVAMGLGAQVTIMDISPNRLAKIDNDFSPPMITRFSSHAAIIDMLGEIDLLIGAVLLPGAAAPKLITKEMLKYMHPGSAIVDVAIDQGGIAETSRPTTHDNPTFIVDDVVHYCVSNMPGALAYTSTIALTNATLPFVLEIAASGCKKAISENRHLRNGLNVYHGAITNQAVAKALGFPYQSDI